MDALTVLLDRSLAYGDALRWLSSDGWAAGGAGISAAGVEIARDAPADLRDWWRAAVGRGLPRALARGMPRIVSPDDWATAGQEPRVLAVPDRTTGYWQLLPDEQVRWVPTSEGDTVPDMLLRTWLAVFWMMEVIHGSQEHQTALLDERTLDRVKTVLRSVPVAAWPWPAVPARLYSTGDLFAVVAPAPEGGWQLRAGARTAEAWTPIADLPWAEF